MGYLTVSDKIEILKTLIKTIKQDHPFFEEESPEWDFMIGAKMFLEELENSTDQENLMDFFNLKVGDKERCKDEHGYCQCNKEEILSCPFN